MKRTAYFIRFIHFIISFYFLLCISFLYYSIFFSQESKILYVAIISILIEGLIVFLNQNNCPLGILHNRYGDDKTFFELFFPKKLAKNVIPIVAIISITGLVIFFIELFFKTL